MRVRLATPDDAATIARIYNAGLEERTATFETRPRRAEEVLAWFDGAHPIVVAVAGDAAEATVIAFARASEYRPRECYRGVFEFGVYTDPGARRRGAGTLAMRELVTQARAAGAWKLVSRIFVENQASRTLVATLGFREVGVYYRHGKLDGRWRDVVVVEKFLAPVGAEAHVGPPPSRAPRDEILIALREADADARAHALDSARAMLDVYKRPDAELLETTADAFFAVKVRDAATRARFIELFRAYASISREAARELYDALFGRLARWSIATELESFYEAAFVVKQVASAGPDGVRALAPDVPRLIDWMEHAIELPSSPRGRISPGNVTSLLMTLALAAADTEEQRQRVVDLSAGAKERHRVEPPASMRPPAPSVPPPSPPRPPPLPPRLPPPLPPPPPASSPKKKRSAPKRPRKKKA